MEIIKVHDTEHNREMLDELNYDFKQSTEWLVLEYNKTLEILLIEIEIFYIKYNTGEQ